MRGRGGYTPRGMRGGVRGVVRGGVHVGRGTPNGMRGSRGSYTPRGRGTYTPRGRGNFNNAQQVASNTWKLQCFFCTDTVSTGKLNRNYYKLHLEAVHNISLNVEKLLNFTLSQQNVGEGGAITPGSSPLTAVANILSMKGITIQRTSDSGAQSSPKQTAGAVIPETLINIKGITVQRVNDGSSQPQQSPQPQPAAPPAPAAPSAAQMRQQEQAINRWANGCEHGCRLCKQKGKSFVSFTRQGLLKHLEQEHEATERDYKEEFKCINLITRASNMTCKECGNRVKRIPTSLNIHLKRHGLNLRSYWLKHLKPGAMPGMRANNVNGSQGRVKSGAHVCQVPGCSRSFDNQTALALHKSWHQRDKPGASEGDDADEIEMEMELDPTAMLEVGIGDEPLEVDLPEDADADEEGKEGLKHSVNRLLGTEDENGVDDGDVKSEPPDPDDADYDQLNTPEAIDIDENDVNDEHDSDGNKTPVLEFPDFPDEEEDEEVVNIDTPEPSLDWVNPIDDQAKADPTLPIPLPDCSDEPAGAPLPPMPDMPTVSQISLPDDEPSLDSDGAPPPPEEPFDPSPHQDDAPTEPEPEFHDPSPEAEPVSQSEPASQPETQASPQVPPSPHNSHPPSPHASHQVPSPYSSQHSHSSPMGTIPSHVSPHGSQNSPMAPPQSPLVSQPSPMVPPQSPLGSQPSPMAQPIITQPAQMLPQPVVLPQHTQPVVISQHMPQPIPDPSFSYPLPPTAHSIPYTTASVYAAPTMSYLPPHATPTMSYLPPHNPYSTSLPPQGRYIPYAPGQATPIHTINDHVEPAYDGRLPLDYWETMSCTVNIDACPIYCCHVRAHQEIAEGRTDWKRPYGPPLHGTVGCSCCVNQ